MFQFLPAIRIPKLLRPTPLGEAAPEPVPEAFLATELDIGLRNRVHTLARKAGISLEIAERIAENHVAADENARVDISRPNEIPGLRRLILMGPAYFQPTSTQCHAPLTMIGITTQGRLFRRGLYVEGGPPSAKDGLRLARHDPQRLFSGVGAADPALSRHSSSSHGQVRDAFHARMSGTLAGMNELPYGFVCGLEHITRARLARRLALARYAITTALDPDSLKLMRGTALYSTSAAAWLSGNVEPEPVRTGPGRWFGVRLDELNDPALAEARHQALRAYPAMARLFFQRSALRAAVDAREPLGPVIAAELGVDESGVRALHGVTWQMAALRPSEPVPGLVRLAKLPPDFRPTQRSEHRQLPAIAAFGQLMSLSMAQAMRHFAQGGSPYRFASELRRISSGDVEDAAGYIADKLLIPMRLRAIHHLQEAEGIPHPASRIAIGDPQRLFRWGAVRDLLTSMSPKAMFEMSDRWHRNIERHEDRLISLRHEARWPALLGNLDLGPVQVRELTSAEDLRTQGRREGHCVGGYTERILRASRDRVTLIFSIEQGQTVLGTAEIAMSEIKTDDARRSPRWQADMVQNRGRHNGPVSMAAIDAANQVRKALTSLPTERILGHMDALRAIRCNASDFKKLPEHIRAAGYDIWDTAHLDAAWAELSAYLPRSRRKAGLERAISADIAALREAHQRGDQGPSMMEIFRHGRGGLASGGKPRRLRLDPEADRQAIARFLAVPSALREPERPKAPGPDEEEIEWEPF